jgi:hypothetical protein
LKIKFNIADPKTSMNKLFSILCILFLPTLAVNAQDTIVLQGHYFGKNLYVLNPSIGKDTVYCLKKILVNNQPTKDELRSNSLEIDFSQLGIQNGADVKIKIIHETACTPKVINPEVLQPQSTFAFIIAKADKTGKLVWQVKGDLFSAFTVEQFRWKKWITLGEVDITDTVKKNFYAFEFKPHFGPMQFRISHTDEKGNIVYSKLIKYRSATAKEIFLTTTKVTNDVTFTGETAYEVFDEKGNYIQDGYGISINITDLAKGKYWINYDNKTEMVTKK